MQNESTIDPVLVDLVRRFAEAQCSWLSSVRHGGQAHSAPVWHVWYQGRAYVITTATAVKVSNIRAHPKVVIAHPDPVDPVIIEGQAALRPDVMDELRAVFKAKYDWDPIESESYRSIIEIIPLKLMAWGKYGEGRWPGSAVGRVRLD